MSRLRAAALATVCAALALSQQACGSGDGAGSPASAPASVPSVETTPESAVPTTAAPTSTAATSAAPKSTRAGGNSILRGDRQVVLLPVPSTESVLAVDEKGRLSTTDGPSDHTLFVLAPAGDGKHLIKTAAVTAGEPSCMGIKGNGRNPLTVVATACDAGRPGQLFTIAKAGKTKNGDPTYAISNQGAYLQLTADYELIAEELGDSPLRTTFAFADNGKSPLAD